MDTKTFKIVNNKGYTLIEILVAVGIFTLVIAAPTGFFVSAIKGQQKALASQKALDETSYALEYMSRAIRMAKKELSDPPICLSSRGWNYEMTRDGNGFKFINYQNQCQEFFWDISDNRLKEIKDGGEAVPLTSRDLEIFAFEIKSHGDSWAQTKPDGITLEHNQPKVTLFLEIKDIIKIQTTISQRNLDVVY